MEQGRRHARRGRGSDLPRWSAHVRGVNMTPQEIQDRRDHGEHSPPAGFTGKWGETYYYLGQEWTGHREARMSSVLKRLREVAEMRAAGIDDRNAHRWAKLKSVWAAQKRARSKKKG